jgi:hypothetical protein
MQVAEPEGYGQKKQKGNVPVERPNKPARAQGIPAITDFFSRIGDTGASSPSIVGGNQPPLRAPPSTSSKPDELGYQTPSGRTTPQGDVHFPSNTAGNPKPGPKTIGPLDILRARGEGNAGDTSRPRQVGQATGMNRESGCANAADTSQIQQSTGVTRERSQNNSAKTEEQPSQGGRAMGMNQDCTHANGAGSSRQAGPAVGVKRERSRSPERDGQGDPGGGELSRDMMRAQLAEAAMKRLKGSGGGRQAAGRAGTTHGPDAESRPLGDPAMERVNRSGRSCNAAAHVGVIQGVDALAVFPCNGRDSATGQLASANSLLDQMKPASVSGTSPAQELLMAHLEWPNLSPGVAGRTSSSTPVDLTQASPSFVTRREGDPRGLEGRAKVPGGATKGMAKDVIELLSSDDDD